LQPGEDAAGGLGDGEEVFFGIPAAGEFGEHLVGFFVDPDGVEGCGAVGGGDDFGEALGDILEFGEVWFGAGEGRVGCDAEDGEKQEGVEYFVTHGGSSERGEGSGYELIDAIILGHFCFKIDLNPGKKGKKVEIGAKVWPSGENSTG